MEYDKDKINTALMSIRTENTDAHGLVVQKNMDGGDTANKVALMYGFLKMLGHPVDHMGRLLNNGYEETMKLLEVESGLYVRHVDAPWNITGPKQNDGDMAFGRDQQDPLIITMGLYQDLDRVTRQVISQSNRKWLYQNKTDVTGLEQAATYVRSLGGTFDFKTRFAIIAGDIASCFGSAIIVVRSILDPDDVSNDLNHAYRLIANSYMGDTLLNKLAKFIYRRRLNAGPKKGQGPRYEGFGPQTAYKHYFRPEEGGPAIDVIVEPLIEKYLR